MVSVLLNRLYNFIAVVSPKSITFLERKVENKSGSYYLSFMKPANCLFSRVLVNITDTDNENTIQQLNYSVDEGKCHVMHLLLHYCYIVPVT